MERSDYLSALVRGWWLIVLFGLVGLAVGLLLPRPNLAKETYFLSTSSFGSTPPAPTSSGDLFGGGITPDQILYYANSDAVMTRTSQLAHLGYAPYLVRGLITLLPPPASNGASSGPSSGQAGVIDVKVSANTTAEALAINNAYDQAMDAELTSIATQGLKSAEQQTQNTLLSVENEIATKNYPLGLTEAALQVQVNALEQHLATLIVQQPNPGFNLLQEPSPSTVSRITPSSATNSRKVRAGAGLAIGLVLGAFAALGLWLLDRRLKTAKRAQAAFGYPVVAEITPEPSRSIETYRMLWLSVFREPLPLPPSDPNERLYEGEDPVLDSGSNPSQAGSR
jgi:capsular polysaccharide biosynthesis protein